MNPNAQNPTLISPGSAPGQNAGAGDDRPARSPLVVALWVFIVLELIAAAGLGYYKLVYKRQPKPVANVKIGLMMAFTGGSSAMGNGANKGVELAKKQLNANNIEVIQEDSKCDPKAAAASIKRLIAKQVVAIIGEGCSSASVAALPAANNAKIPMISPSASSPKLTIPSDYFFRVIPPDTKQGAFMAQAIYDKGLRSVAVFYTNEPYGIGMNQVFQEKFEALGGKVVATAFSEPDDIDLGKQISSLTAAKPEAIFVAPNSVITGTAVIKLAHEASKTTPLFGADIFYDKTIIANAPEAVEGLTITSFPTGSKAFKQAIANEYPNTDQLYAAPQAYDAFTAIYKAVKQGATTGEQVKNALTSMSFQGVSATIAFDQNGEISDPGYKYDLLQIKNGKFTVVE